MKLIFLFVMILQFVGISLSDDCNAPTWTIKDFSVKFGREVSSGAQTKFSITSSMTGKTDAVSCSLRANSRCEIRVAASGINILFQAFLDSALFTINQTQICEGKST
jgi:hypothetical protein